VQITPTIMQPDRNTLDLCVAEERRACKSNRTDQIVVAVISRTFTAKVPVLYVGWDTGNPDCGFA
jgi:hypothetical protein